MAANPKLYPVSLGCAKNRVDTEIMLGLLSRAGWEIVSQAATADVLLVNTCGFIAPASQESIDTVLELAAYKQADPKKRLVVTGCLAQRYRTELPALLPEVDAFIGVNDFPQIVRILAHLNQRHETSTFCQAPCYGYQEIGPRLLTTPFYSAYLKIAEGCSHRCTYCTIPQIRGPFRSRPLEVILQEARNLSAQGVCELNLIAQDTTAYGLDWGEPHQLPKLLKGLCQIPGIHWLRLLYSHPARITPELLTVMADHPQICPYLDLPLQHVNDQLLKRMGRGYNKKVILDTIDRSRRVLPQAALRTTVMVGFPGETEDQFAELCQVIEQIGFDHLGVFEFQPEEGTPACGFTDQVPVRLARQRARQLMALQARLVKKKLRSLVGTVQEVLVEGPSPETELLLCGRLATQAPEVDGQVYITAGDGQIGQIQPVRITSAHTYDLVGEIIAPIQKRIMGKR
ncbi:MAG: 30S ribosomal protein S12 methylthiotransferase RimO [Deltaproteobacteria bacterium]|nr:30S ribosomal protein S12 methylthiotransferase RimO [Deltaproteobacteria bacterium]